MFLSTMKFIPLWSLWLWAAGAPHSRRQLFVQHSTRVSLSINHRQTYICLRSRRNSDHSTFFKTTI